MGKEPTLESFRGFFVLIGAELASKIEFVCSDMWQLYHDVIREKCSQALNILDRFHIVAKMNMSECRHSRIGQRRQAEVIAQCINKILLNSEVNFGCNHRSVA